MYMVLKLIPDPNICIPWTATPENNVHLVFILMFFSSWHILFHFKTFFQIGCEKCDKFFHSGCVGVSNFTCAMCTSLDQHLVNLEPDLRKDPPKVYFTK